jgi:hypothetical protein
MYYTTGSLTTGVPVMLPHFLMIYNADENLAVPVPLSLSEHMTGSVNKSLLKQGTHITCSIPVYLLKLIYLNSILNSNNLWNAL